MIKGIHYFDRFDSEHEKKMSELEYAITHGRLRTITTYDGVDYEEPSDSLNYTDEELKFCVRKYGFLNVFATKLKFGIKQKIHFALWAICRLFGADFYTKNEIRTATKQTFEVILERGSAISGSAEKDVIQTLTKCATNIEAFRQVGNTQQSAIPQQQVSALPSNDNSQTHLQQHPPVLALPENFEEKIADIIKQALKVTQEQISEVSAEVKAVTEDQASTPTNAAVVNNVQVVQQQEAKSVLRPADRRIVRRSPVVRRSKS